MILFSPIGSTDPISGQHDGALIHIIRHYRPDKVYLYLSKEIAELEELDNRYSYCLERLKDHLGADFEVEWIIRKDLVDVHLFDFFLLEYRTILDKLVTEDEQIILNVSSGTPAMKSALQILSSVYERPLMPIQVSTPQKSINDREDVKGDYSVELQWECNLDNEDCHINRCSVSSVLNMNIEMKKNIIKKHIQAYDYVAAYRVAEPIKDYISDNSLKLLEAGCARLELNRSGCDKCLNDIDYDMFPEKRGNYSTIFEYIMLMYIKLYKHEYADYIRMVTPVFFVLMERLIQSSNQLNLDHYTYIPPKQGRKWKAKTIAGNKFLEAAGINYDYDKVIMSEDYARIIAELNIDYRIKRLVDDIRSVEKKIRNSAAHSIIHVSDAVIKQETGYKAKEIFSKLKELAVAIGISFGDDALRTYDKLNERIIQELNCN